MREELELGLRTFLCDFEDDNLEDADSGESEESDRDDELECRAIGTWVFLAAYLGNNKCDELGRASREGGAAADSFDGAALGSAGLRGSTNGWSVLSRFERFEFNSSGMDLSHLERRVKSLLTFGESALDCRIGK